jgi:hypothetical protein
MVPFTCDAFAASTAFAASNRLLDVRSTTTRRRLREISATLFAAF